MLLSWVPTSLPTSPSSSSATISQLLSRPLPSLSTHSSPPSHDDLLPVIAAPGVHGHFLPGQWEVYLHTSSLGNRLDYHGLPHDCSLSFLPLSWYIVLLGTAMLCYPPSHSRDPCLWSPSAPRPTGIVCRWPLPC